MGCASAEEIKSWRPAGSGNGSVVLAKTCRSHPSDSVVLVRELVIEGKLNLAHGHCVFGTARIWGVKVAVRYAQDV